jgi:dihydroorotase
MSTTRRQFLTTAGSFALTAVGTGLAEAAMGPNDKFDLVIKGGDVLDPSQSLRGRRDIGIRFGVIEALEADIPAARAQRVLDATGKLVTPGLVDLHTHVYPYGSAIGIPADELVAYQCTTTCVSAGDAGANNFAAFRRYVAAQTRTRVYAFVHIANIGLAGFPVAELYNIDFAQTDVAGAGDCREHGYGARREGAHVGECDRQEWAGAAQTCDQRVRERGHRRQGDVPHRWGGNTRADVADP